LIATCCSFANISSEQGSPHLVANSCLYKYNLDKYATDADSVGEAREHVPTLSQAPPSDGSVVEVYPGDDLAAVATSYGAGTIFHVHGGYYLVSAPIVVSRGDVWKGIYSDDTRPCVTTTAKHVFYVPAEAEDATIRSLDVSGAVHDDRCEPDCGRGIGGPGSNLLVEDVRSHHNENQGVGGTGAGLVIRNSELDHNGSYDATTGKVSAAGVKAINSYSVFNSYIHDNYWDGVWCDIECGRFEVHDSNIVYNGKAGIHYEISTGPAVFEGNTITGNGYTYWSTRRGGILIVGSSNAQAYGNTFGNNGFYERAVEAVNDSRMPAVSGVSIHDNTLNSDQLTGCDLPRVSCPNNH
jgi:hypothetical protein